MRELRKLTALLASFLAAAVVYPSVAGALAIPDREIWLVATDGSAERRLTRDRVQDDNPIYLPDGRIAFLRTRRAGFIQSPSDIWTMRADGRGKRRVARTPVTREFGLESGHFGTIAATTIRGRDVLVATQGPPSARISGLVAWDLTPTGLARKRILRRPGGYVTRLSGSRDALVATTLGGRAFRTRDGRSWRRLAGSRYSGVAISPDGSRIAFTRGGALWLADGDGRRARRIVRPGRGLSGIGSPVFTADGRGIIFSWTRCPDTTSSLYRTSLTGRPITRLTKRRGKSDTASSLSPNGRWIAIDRSRTPGPRSPCELP